MHGSYLARRAATSLHADPPPPPPPKKRLPERGYFAPADPNVPIPKPRLLAQSDVTKRGGRWEAEFIWNTNWKEQMDYEEKLREEKKAAENAPPEETTGPGALKLTSVASLDNVNVDLSDQLKAARAKRLREEREAEARRKAAEAARAARASQSTSSSPSIAPQGPLRREVKRLERGNKFSTRPFALSPTNPVDEALLEATRAAEQARYDELKQEMLTWTAVLAAGCFGMTYAFYTRDTAASYGVGALGGYIYLRLLNQSVDSVGGGVGGALAQPRLLVPVVLVMVFNRWNTLRAEEVGLHLQLLPMLAGFFTYKAAVIFKYFGQLVQDYLPQKPDETKGTVRKDGQEEDAEMAEILAADAANRIASAASVDRAFRSKILRG